MSNRPVPEHRRRVNTRSKARRTLRSAARPAFLMALLFVSVLELSACAGTHGGGGGDAPIPVTLDGLYRGRYWLTIHDGTSEQQRQDGQCWMRFDKGKYEVEGDFALLPPSGGGEYVIDGRSVTLTDTAVHTADFDWTLILEGRFDVDMGGDGSVRLTQRDLAHARYHELELKPVDE